MAPAKKKTVSSGANPNGREPEPTAPNTDHLSGETEPPTQDQTLPEQRIVTFEGTTKQDNHNLRSTKKSKAATSTRKG
jgi:hypothetical protein